MSFMKMIISSGTTNSSQLNTWRTPTLIKFNDELELATDGLDGVMDDVNASISYTSRNQALERYRQSMRICPPLESGSVSLK